MRAIIGICLTAVLAAAQAQAPTAGSTAFCLFPLLADDSGRQRWINLAIVQYVETARNEMKIVFGGGNLGSGHEVRVAVTNGEDSLLLLERMRQAAAACR